MITLARYSADWTTKNSDALNHWATTVQVCTCRSTSRVVYFRVVYLKVRFKTAWQTYVMKGARCLGRHLVLVPDARGVIYRGASGPVTPAKRKIYESKILQLKCLKSLSKWITYITYLSFRCLKLLIIGAQNFEISSFKRTPIAVNLH